MCGGRGGGEVGLWVVEEGRFGGGRVVHLPPVRVMVSGVVRRSEWWKWCDNIRCNARGERFCDWLFWEGVFDITDARQVS